MAPFVSATTHIFVYFQFIKWCFGAYRTQFAPRLFLCLRLFGFVLISQLNVYLSDQAAPLCCILCPFVVLLALECRPPVSQSRPLLQSPHHNRKGHHQMAPKPIPHFSDFLSMRRSNPNQYWLPVTAVQMANAYQHHGPAYFDLHKDKST